MKPSNLRQHNQRLILSHLQQMERGSKAAIAESCGMSKPTAGKIIDELVSAQVLRAEANDANDTQAVSSGRPIQMLRLDRETSRFALIEISVNQLQCRTVSVSGFEQSCVKYIAPKNAQEFLSIIQTWWSSLKHADIWACALAVPGVVDEEQNRVLKSPNIPWTEDKQWFEKLSAIVRCSICMVQEIRALALAHLQSDDSKPSFLYVYCDQGLGGALVINRSLFGGASALSAELGHTPIAGNTRRCGCGNSGCLETIVATAALCQTFSVSTWAECLEIITAQPALMHGILDHLARHIAAAVNVSGVHDIILGEKLNEYPEVLKTYLENKIRSSCLWSQFGEIQIAYSNCAIQRGLVSQIWDKFLATTIDWKRPCQIQSI